MVHVIPRGCAIDPGPVPEVGGADAEIIGLPEHMPSEEASVDIAARPLASTDNNRLSLTLVSLRCFISPLVWA